MFFEWLTDWPNKWWINEWMNVQTDEWIDSLIKPSGLAIRQIRSKAEALNAGATFGVSGSELPSSPTCGLVWEPESWLYHPTDFLYTVPWPGPLSATCSHLTLPWLLPWPVVHVGLFLEAAQVGIKGVDSDTHCQALPPPGFGVTLGSSFLTCQWLCSFLCIVRIKTVSPSQSNNENFMSESV